ncbi:tetraspanin-15-like [Liolophura sinensis]|uniref:tetraspanin-15-like n=1 Tax=Liolophura sinensis TaxID=3198878 RepID=UPI0031597670
MAAENEDGKKMLPNSDSKPRSHPRKPLCACTTYSLNKLFLFIYAFLFLIIGLILLVVGIWAETERRQYRYLNNQLSAPVALLIFVGLFIAVNSLFGVLGTLKENVTLLKLFLVLTVLAFLAQVVIGILGFVFRERIPALTKHGFLFAIEDYTSSDNIRLSVDRLQMGLECCGLESYKDYEENADFACGSGKPEACSVPQSCCRPAEDGTRDVNCGVAIRYNVSSVKIEERIFYRGCISTFKTWIVEHLDVVGAVALGFAIPQIFGILLAYFFIRRVEEMIVWYRVGNF